VGLLETRCSKGELEICREVLVGRDGNPPPTDGPARVGIEGGLLQGNRPKLNRTDFAVLDRMLESIGDVSFRSVWSSDLALADAFAVEVDVSIEAWWAGVLKELRAEAPVRETTVVNRTQLGRSFLLIVATVLLSVAVSVRRRVA